MLNYSTFLFPTIDDPDGFIYNWGSKDQVYKLSDFLKGRLSTKFFPLIDTDSIANWALMKTYECFRIGDGSFSSIDETEWMSLCYTVAIRQQLNEIDRYKLETGKRCIIGTDPCAEQFHDKRQPEEATIDAEDLQLRVSCKLNERERFVLEHRLLDETDEEIAMALGTCARTVSRARARIAKVANYVMNTYKEQGTRNKEQKAQLDFKGFEGRQNFF